MSVSGEQFRAIMGNFATGVTIVTTAHQGQLAGMTANAVSSVSLDPLLLLFCADKKTRTHDLIDQSGAFALNILTQQQQDASNLFAKSGVSAEERFSGVSHTTAPSGSPLIDGNMGWVDCRVVHRYAGGDHTIFVGEVLAADFREGDPLLFFKGRYGRLAE